MNKSGYVVGLDSKICHIALEHAYTARSLITAMMYGILERNIPLGAHNIPVGSAICEWNKLIRPANLGWPPSRHAHAFCVFRARKARSLEA
jgi:hypothetical protein